jgi:peptidylprolyl isomerase
MARSQDPNSANSQFFICFADAPFLNNKYSVVGEVTSGMDVVDEITKGDKAANGAVTDPDKIVKMQLASGEAGQEISWPPVRSFIPAAAHNAGQA